MKHPFQWEVPCDEKKIQETIAVSKAAFLAGESEQSVSHLEFLYQQRTYIQKRWWVLQGLLLILACILLHSAETDFTLRRTLGLTGPLFAILILPEVWKNRSFEALEVEGTTFYTLRSIYAARLTLFAGVDLALLSAFFAGASFLTKLTLWQMLTQLVLPLNVTCCICFATLYSRRIHSQPIALMLCVLWSAVWSMVILDDAVFRAISVPMWIAMLAASVFCMGYILCRGQTRRQNTWEGKPIWI